MLKKIKNWFTKFYMWLFGEEPIVEPPTYYWNNKEIIKVDADEDN